MIFSILQLISNLRAERARNREREQARIAGAKVLHSQGEGLSLEPKPRDTKPTVHNDGLERHRAEMEALRAWLREERERNEALESRILALSERLSNRANGHNADGNGDKE